MILRGFFFMKAVVFAGGYATRLYPLTKNYPKHLLKVNGKPIIEYIVDKLLKMNNISGIYIVTNNRFYNFFEKWKNNYNQEIEIINDGTNSNKDRLGAIGNLFFAIKKKNINEDCLAIAGDNLFGFSLIKFVEFFQEKQTSIVAFLDLKEKDKVANRFGVGIIEENKLIGFEEKPENPKTTLASTACYVFKKEDFNHIENFLINEKADNSGDLINYLVNNSMVHAFVFDEHWFDVGTYESLKEAEEFYKNAN